MKKKKEDFRADKKLFFFNRRFSSILFGSIICGVLLELIKSFFF